MKRCSPVPRPMRHRGRSRLWAARWAGLQMRIVAFLADVATLTILGCLGERSAPPGAWARTWSGVAPARGPRCGSRQPSPARTTPPHRRRSSSSTSAWAGKPLTLCLGRCAGPAPALALTATCCRAGPNILTFTCLSSRSSTAYRLARLPTTLFLLAGQSSTPG
jgi:hypothetical protein